LTRGKKDKTKRTIVARLLDENHRVLNISDSDCFIYMMAVLLVFIMAARTPLDGDMWWHLRAGQETITQRAPLLEDTFSFTRAGEPWVNHSWLSQVGMAALFRWLEYYGLTLGVAFLAVGSLLIVLLQMEGPSILNAFLLIFAGVVAAPVWSPRPQTTSLLMLALVSYVLHLYKRRGINRLWLLPMLMMLWSNLHGGYVLGFLCMGAMLAGEALNHMLGYKGEEIISWKRLLNLLVWTASSGLAVLINPNGLNMWLIPFQTVEVQVLQSLIAEWASPNFHELAQQPLLWMTFALFIAVGLSDRKLDGSDIVAVTGFGMMAFIARRNFGPFALVSLPVLSRHLWAAFQQWWGGVSLPEKLVKFVQSRQTKEMVNTSKIQRVMNLLVIGLFGLIAAGKVIGVSHPALVDGYMKQVYPVQAVAWIKENGVQGNLLNEYNWGGYLDWFSRETPVFVDGRTDLYGDEVLGQWLKMVQGGDGWQEWMDDWQIDVVLLQPDRPLVNLLLEEGWEVDYGDEEAILLSH
jgi:hypothetical protein